MAERRHRLRVSEHHNTFSDSEVVRVDIDCGPLDGKYAVIVEHLASQSAVVVDIDYPDGQRMRHEHILYTDPPGEEEGG